MTLKDVMSLSEPINAFVRQFNKLLTDADSGEFVRVLDMKGLRKVDQAVSHCAFSSNLFHGYLAQILINQLSDPENKKCSP